MCQINSQESQRWYNLQVYTIGHSNLSIEAFVELLKLHDIVHIVDVRSIPYSKYLKDFNRENIENALYSRGIEYRWMGDSLGGKREDKMNSAGIRMDDAYYEDPKYRTGMVNLMRKALKKRTAIMCSEENPRKCHRHKIISISLLKRHVPECEKLHKITVLHIRSDGRLENAANLYVPVQMGLPI